MFHVKHFNMNEQITQCPVCKNEKFEPFLTAEDHFLTKEKFEICGCSSCGFRFINPRPPKEEIGRYYQSEAYISHNASEFNLLTTIYKAARFLAIRSKYALIKRHAKGTRLLDIGCGTGEVLKYCKSRGFYVQGVEPTGTARKFAVENNGLDVKATLGELDPGAEPFNCITLWHVLEHIHELDASMEQIKGMLDPEGTLIIAVPNCDAMDAQAYGRYWAAYDVPRHLYHFTKETFQKFAENHGFVLKKTVPQKMDSYYVSLLSEKYKTGKSNYLTAFVNGFISNYAAKTKGYGHSSLIFLLSVKKM